MTKLTNDEIKRYSRHLVLQEFGLDNQLKLKEARVLVVGAGGLGCPALLYLTAAGVGTLGIADFDTIDLSNLQRQILFTMDDLGKNKSMAASDRLKELNPNVHFRCYPKKLLADNVIEILNDFDVVVDGTDNFQSRYLLNDACVLTGKPLVYGSILRFEGQVAVFNHKNASGHSSNYRDLFPLEICFHSRPIQPRYQTANKRECWVCCPA
jgi:sulfur-carrier protein adenylyltransferase/sulfurtransferase